VKPLVNMRDALADPALLGSILAGPSWAAWRSLLIASRGEPLTNEERELFTRLTGRPTEPLERVDELWGVVGRRSGKSRAAATLATYLAALVDHSANLSVGERGLVLFIAENQKQAGVVFRYVAGIFDAMQLLAELVVNRTADTISLSNGIDLEIRAASFRGLRGPTCVAVVADEAAFFGVEGAVNADTEILNAVRPALATTGGPLIVISSPYAKRGEVWNTFKRHYGASGDPRILVAQGESRSFNPTLPQAVIDRAIERDSAAASSEYLGQFRNDVGGWADLALIEAAVDRGVMVRPPVRGIYYRSFCDASGGVRDSFTAAIAHAEDRVAILDCLVEIRAPFNPDAATAQISNVLKAYRCYSTVGDRYGGAWISLAFRKCGVRYDPSERDRSSIYLDALPLFTTGRARLLDNKRLVAQFAALERKTSPIGRDRVDHGLHGADDCCNAAAGAMVLAVSRQPMIISEAVLAKARLPSPARPMFRQRTFF
jgi:hypothetical protein